METNTKTSPFLNDQENVETKKKEIVPANYIPVKLSSLGKLSVPKVIHVRNYSGEETLKLSTMNEDNSLQLLTDVIQSLIFEDVDVGMMNENEVEELMLNIYVNWWNTQLDYPYEYTEEELKNIDEERADNVRSGGEIPKVQINISEIKTTPIMSEFKEPIIISHAGIKYYFRLSRVQDMLNAKNFVMDKYIEEENKFSQIKKALEYNAQIEDNNVATPKKINPQELRAYREYLTRRALDFEKISQMSKVTKFGNVEINTDEDKLNYYKEIPSDIWVKLNDVIDKSIQFGVNPELSVKSPLTGEEVIRRFQFQVLDFIPTLELPDSSEYTVVFGEQ